MGGQQWSKNRNKINAKTEEKRAELCVRIKSAEHFDTVHFVY